MAEDYGRALRQKIMANIMAEHYGKRSWQTSWQKINAEDHGKTSMQKIMAEHNAGITNQISGQRAGSPLPSEPSE